MEIQRPPEVVSKTEFPVRKIARLTISPNKLFANNTVIIMLGGGRIPEWDVRL